MAIEIKETVGFKCIHSNQRCIDTKESVSTAVAPRQLVSPNSVMAEIEGIHADILTVNDTMYSAKCLENSLPYWTYPYERPVIMHHNEQNGEIIGRIKKVDLVDSDQSKTKAIQFTCNIGDKKGIEGIENGTLSTVSVGGMAYDVRCSICNANIAEGDCGHEKGQIYKGKLCYWIIEELVPKEISYVIVPSDKYAQTMKVYKPSKKDIKQIKESVEVSEKMSVCDELIKSLKNSVIEDDEDNKGLHVTEAAEEKEEKDDKAAKIHVDEEVKEEDEGKEKKPKDKDDGEEKPEESAAEEKEDDDREEKEEKEEKDDEGEEKNDEEDNKQEEDSNKEDERDKEIELLKEEIRSLKEELGDIKKELKDKKKELKDAKDMKEAADLELAKYRVQEKVSVASKIKHLKESVGITCEDADTIAKNNSIDELNLIYKTLSETCKYTTKLPGKLVAESAIDEDSDNLSKDHVDVAESAEFNDEDGNLKELQKLHKKFFNI